MKVVPRTAVAALSEAAVETAAVYETAVTGITYKLFTYDKIVGVVY